MDSHHKMLVATPQLQLETLFVLNGGRGGHGGRRRIRSTLEPRPSAGPAFVFIRGAAACAWAVRADVSERVAGELDRWGSQEPPSAMWDEPLRHARRYAEILGGLIKGGPAFQFPDRLLSTTTTMTSTTEREGACIVRDEAALNHHFRGWVTGEIDAGRGPVLAVRDEQGRPVSVCFCARRSPAAAETGVETAREFRGRGYAPRVVTAWAAAVREQGVVPLYSTGWENHASLAVARKLGLVRFATDFSIDV
jgi:hypothetical protein